MSVECLKSNYVPNRCDLGGIAGVLVNIKAITFGTVRLLVHA